jgi:hypothetical protein
MSRHGDAARDRNTSLSTFAHVLIQMQGCPDTQRKARRGRRADRKYKTGSDNSSAYAELLEAICIKLTSSAKDSVVSWAGGSSPRAAPSGRPQFPPIGAASLNTRDGRLGHFIFRWVLPPPVESCPHHVYHQDRRQHQIPTALAARPVPNFPRLRALALFGRRLVERAERLSLPASKNLHRFGGCRCYSTTQCSLAWA